MPFVQSGSARIHWEAEGQGVPILLIMGHLYSARMWYPLLPALKDYRVIRFDNRGTGQSDTTSGVTVEQMAADARAVLDAAGEADAHVYGVSMGGGIAGEFGMAYPERVRSLTLGCTMLKTETNTLNGVQKLMYHLPRWMIRAVFKRAKPENYGTAAPRERALRDIEMLSTDQFTMKGVRAQAKAIASYAASPERAATRLTMPVLVLHGDEDRLVPVEKGRELAATIPGSSYVEFRGAGHNYLVAANEASTAAFLDFIAAADRARGDTK
jgi:pimeloyl-ACP methyl ester carboxylesterase